MRRQYAQRMEKLERSVLDRCPCRMAGEKLVHVVRDADDPATWFDWRAMLEEEDCEKCARCGRERPLLVIEHQSEWWGGASPWRNENCPPKPGEVEAMRQRVAEEVVW